MFGTIDRLEIIKKEKLRSYSKALTRPYTNFYILIREKIDFNNSQFTLPILTKF